MAETKQQRWNRKHPETMKVSRERSSTKHFIKSYATEEDLEALRALIVERADHLSKLEDDEYDDRRHRLKRVHDVIRRHSGPEAKQERRWGDSVIGSFNKSDVQTEAKVYPYIYQGQYYAVALFDERVCVGLPQYAHFRPKAEQVWDLPMPMYYNKIFKRADWPQVRALLQTKYDFHEVVRVRYLLDAFVEKVGNEYFYPISGWPMMTEDPDHPGQYQFDQKTNTRTIKDVAKTESTSDQLPELVTFLESTIDQTDWDKLSSKQQEAFARITDQTTYAAGSEPLKETIGEDD